MSRDIDICSVGRISDIQGEMVREDGEAGKGNLDFCMVEFV